MTIKDEAGPQVPPAVGEFATQERAKLLSDNADLRARLAKYEDAEGRPVVEYSIGAFDRMQATIAEQAREIERLGLMVSQSDFNYDQDRSNWQRELAALKAQPSGVVLPEPEIASEINRLIGLWDAKVVWSGQCMEELLDHAAKAATLIARLNSSPVSAGDPEKCSYQDDPRSPAELSLAGCNCVRFGEGNPHWPCKLHTPVSACGVAERAAFEAWYLGHFYMGDKQCGLEWLSTEPCGGYRHQHPAEQWIVWQARAALSAPSHGEQVRGVEWHVDDSDKEVWK